jgi:hypothetical protein
MNKKTPINWRDLPRAGQVVIYVITALDRLRDIGVIQGGQFQGTDESRRMADEMEESAVAGTWERPTQTEISQVVYALQHPEDVPTIQ